MANAQLKYRRNCINLSCMERLGEKLQWNGIVGEETNYVCGLIIALKINLSDETRV